MEQLIKKLTDVGQSLPAFSADKTNTQQRYDYISADAILSIVGRVLAENGVMIIPAVSDEQIEVVNPKPNQTRYDSLITLRMTVTDGADSFESMWIGRGSDYMTPDKATYKAITSGHKYYLMKLFNIGIGNEDGEHDNQPAQQVTAQELNVQTQPGDTFRANDPTKQVAQLEANVKRNSAGILALIADSLPHYNHVNHVKSTLKKLGHDSWPVGDDNAGARLTMYGELAQYAAYRDSGMDGAAALDAVKNEQGEG